ncbi:MAG: bifunctional metallophosphatase/5'-nucleotidase [Deltaproteobacteria bacterium]|nr:bifunctional metallophosphatase/5'-nucleotidase [Deltaproteobacteria bacterium]
MSDLKTRAFAGVTTALVVLLLATGCGENNPLSLHGQVRATFIHTSDIHSRLFPYNLQITHIDAAMGLGTIDEIVSVGGAARMSYIVHRERARAHRVLHLDSGDSFQGAPVFNYYNGEAEFRALSAMGLNAAVVANHEFDKGVVNLTKQGQQWASFPLLLGNYKLDDPAIEGAGTLGSVAQPFAVFDLDGLKVGMLGTGALSSITSLYDQPNSLGALPLKTSEIVQAYVDLLRPQVDLMAVLSHLGVSHDQEMIKQTEGLDFVFGGHNHIVLQPPKKVSDCGWVDQACQLECENTYGSDDVAAASCIRHDCHYIEIKTPGGQDPDQPSEVMRRRCRPRDVVLVHSGAFAKYLGRLDTVVSNDPADFPAGRVLSELNGFELVSHKFRLFPVNDTVPEDPVLLRALEPYAQGLDELANLELQVGFAPYGSQRFSPTGGDSPLGNLIATAMWLRVGVQTDFSLTNTTGIRANIVPGAFDIEQMFNIFPFDNSIATMQLSGMEVQELFDYVARRSAGRGCTSQVQVAGARMVMDCTWDDPNDELPPGKAVGIYIGVTQTECTSDANCPGEKIGSCDHTIGRCWVPIQPIASYELATSNYLAGGGSGFRVLQRNTTQSDTGIQQRDALIDYVRAGDGCGTDDEGTLTKCATNDDCVARLGEGFVCACPSATVEGEVCSTDPARTCPLASGNPQPGDGACVVAGCRDSVAAAERAICERAPDEETRDECLAANTPCATGGEQCKFLACVDASMGNGVDGRILMVGK